MKLKTVIFENSIDEVPINDFETIGNFSKRYSFRDKIDRTIVTSPKAVTKIRNQFAKTSKDFDFWFMNDPRVKEHKEIGNVDLPFIRNELKHSSLDDLSRSDISSYVGAVSLNSGKFDLIDIKSNPLAIEWVLAFASMPMLFNPISINNEMWVDGGVKSVTPLKELVKIIGLENIGHIDVILANPTSLEENKKERFNSIVSVATSCLGAAVNEIMNTDLDINSFNGTYSIYKPQQSLQFDAFNFDPKHLLAAIKQGYNETLETFTK